jgi:biotin transport system substrate-specific component
VRALATWSGALAGLMLILIGSLLPAALLVPLPLSVVELPATWQVPALLLCALVCGPRAGVIAAVAYLSIGLTDLPVFQSGGGITYVLEPGFGYLAGFIPAAWLTGRLSQQNEMGDLTAQTGSAIAGLIVLQLCGLLNLGLGALLSRWSVSLPQLIVQYSLGPLPAQLLLCCGVGLIAVVLRRLLMVPG